MSEDKKPETEKGDKEVSNTSVVPVKSSVQKQNNSKPENDSKHTKNAQADAKASSTSPSSTTQPPSSSTTQTRQNQANVNSDAYYYQYPRYYPYTPQYYQNYYSHAYPAQAYQSHIYPPTLPIKKGSKKPAIAGALLIIAGIFTILFSSIIFVSGAFMWNANDNENYWLEWQSGDLVNIMGTVSNSESMPIDNVTVSVTGTHLYSITNSTGQYRLSGVPCGYREIKLEKDGFRTIIYRTQLKEHDSDNFPNYGNDGENYNYDNLTQGNALIFDFTMTPGNDTVTYGPSMHETNLYLNKASIWLGICGTFTLISGIFSIIGGFYSMKRKRFGLAISGAILGIFGFGFALGTILSIVALFILLLSTNEFDNDKNKNKDDEGGHTSNTQPPPDRSPSSSSTKQKNQPSNEPSIHENEKKEEKKAHKKLVKKVN